MRVRLLGPVDVAVDGASRPVSGLRRKAVLAALALHDGEVLSTGRLVDLVWGRSAPPSAAGTLQNHVSYLRGVLLSKTAILARPPGYVLDLGGDGTDVQVARRLLREGTQAADPCDGVRQFRAALALWRGEPLADAAGSAWLEMQAGELGQLRDRIMRALADARLAAGEHAELIPDLERMLSESPLDEQVHGQLMLALYRCGRQADALAVYHRLRSALDEQLGLAPNPMLRDLETAILRQDDALAVPDRVLAPAGTPRAPQLLPVPAQLPRAVRGFTGRAAELARLDGALARVAREDLAGLAGVDITAVSGTAGVGKTALAVHWAHRVAAQFPDGQLYLNLRGFDPGGQAVEPGEAVRGFLDAFGVPVARIPAGFDAQAALYRSLLAGKRVLVVLDNARDAGQVRPLLPGAPGCLVIVTSRNKLAGLVAAEGALPLDLDLLAADEARDLLARRLGAARLASEPEATDEIIQRCARLPLTLTIAAALAATKPGVPLSAIAADLREAPGPLDPFSVGDPAVDVRAVFSGSYRALSTDAARLFRLLGLAPGPDIGITAAASLAAIAVPRARVLLGELASAHLLTEHSPGRYALHDLLHAYASEQARERDHPEERHAAVRRVIEHYLHTAHAGTALIEPYHAPITPGPRSPGVVTGLPATADAALAWFGSERAALLAAVQLAAGACLVTHAWQLALTMTSDLLRGALWEEHATACNAALAAARRAGDTTGEAHALLALATGYSRSGRFDQAGPLFDEALRLLESTRGYLCSRAVIHGQLAWIAERQDRPADMLRHSMEGFELYRAAGNRPMQVIMLNDIGYSHARAGDYQQALVSCEQALAGLRELGKPDWEAFTWHSLGYVHHKLGDCQRAIDCYQRAIDLGRQIGDRYNTADILSCLGDVYLGMGDASAARQTWALALRIFEDIDHPDGDLIRAKLQARGARIRPFPAAASKALTRRNGRPSSGPADRPALASVPLAGAG